MLEQPLALDRSELVRVPVKRQLCLQLWKQLHCRMPLQQLVVLHHGLTYHSGISPPTDPSSEDRSRTGDESRRAPGRVPAAMSIVRSISEQPQQQGTRPNQSTTPEML